MAKDGQLTYEMCELAEKRFPGGPNAMTRRLWEYLWKFRADMEAVKKEAKKRAAAGRCGQVHLGGDGSHRGPTYRSSTTSATEVQAAGTEAPFEDEFSVEESKLRHQTAVERYIELKLIDYAELRRKCLEREDKSETVHQAADVLPSSEVLEKIMRYEGSLERQLYRALNQLERLQRRRGGEKVAAPLMMDVMK